MHRNYSYVAGLLAMVWQSLLGAEQSHIITIMILHEGDVSLALIVRLFINEVVHLTVTN